MNRIFPAFLVSFSLLGAQIFPQNKLHCDAMRCDAASINTYRETHSLRSLPLTHTVRALLRLSRTPERRGMTEPRAQGGEWRN
uniref:Putative secreted protein n=1 Tax=Anopheles triannulatus TaxID=58253 RepID=A0A2M4B2C4_9DIPT